MNYTVIRRRSNGRYLRKIMHTLSYAFRRHYKRVKYIKINVFRTPISKKEKLFGIRHLQAFLMFTGLFLAYAIRITTSVAIVAMTDPNASTSDVATFPEWSKQTQDTILSSFFWGYVILQIPSGMLSERYGAKMLLTISFLSNGLFSLILPLMAFYGGWGGVCACRVLQGLGQGAIFPCMHGLQARWMPASEKTRMIAFIYAGCLLGTVVELITAGYIAGSSVGWPTIFYTVGVGCFLWTAAWIYMGADSPRKHRWTSDEEIMYIEASYGEPKKKFLAPWKSILTSAPFWGLLLAHCAQNWGFWTLVTEMPSYMNSVLNVDIKSNGLLTSLPYLMMYLFSFVFSFSAEYVINKKIITTTASRKIFNTIGHMGPAIFLVGLSYTPEGDVLTAVALLTFTVGLNAAHYVGFIVNHIDLSPNFAATMMGITNMASNILSIIAPLSVGLVVKDETNAAEWRTVFFISAGIYFIGNLAFCIFGTAKIQPWNYISPSDNVNQIENATEKQEGISNQDMKKI